MMLQVVTTDVIQVYLLGGSTVRQPPLGTVVSLKHLSVDKLLCILVHPLGNLTLADKNDSA